MIEKATFILDVTEHDIILTLAHGTVIRDDVTHVEAMS